MGQQKQAIGNYLEVQQYRLVGVLAAFKTYSALLCIAQAFGRAVLYLKCSRVK